MQSDGFNSALSPVVYGDIALSVNTQYNTNMDRETNTPENLNSLLKKYEIY